MQQKQERAVSAVREFKINDSIYVILIHDYDVLIPLGYEKDLNTAKRKAHTFLELFSVDDSDIPVYDINKEVTGNGAVICQVPYHGIEEYLYEGQYVL